MMPRVLKNFNVIIEGRPMVGLAEELTLPPLERKTDEYQSGGMLGPVDMDMGMTGMKLEFTLAEFNPDVLAGWGLGDASGLPVRFLGAAQSDDSTTATDAIEIAVRGRWKKIEQGSVKRGDRSKMKVEMPITYYRYSRNGLALIEIDLIAGKEIVNGIDRSAGVMQALGLAS